MAEFVDKKEVLKIIDNVPSDFSYWAITDGIIVIKPDAFDRMHKEIDSIKKEDVAPVIHAKWIDHSEEDDAGYYKCSNCEEPWVLMEGTPDDNKMNYCPTCGAKMDLEG